MGKHASRENRKFSLQLTHKDKVFYGATILITAVVMLAFVAIGQSNIFIIPAMFCIALYWRKYRRTVKKI